MAYNHYPGWTREELESELRRATEAQLSGRLTAWGAESASSQRQVELHIDVVIQRIRFSLYLIAPEDYPLESIQRVTRTKARF